MNARNRIAVVCGLMLSVLCPAASLAGPLDPPAGPVAATGPTMIFALPYTISAPGSYKVARPLTAVGPFSGISINASNVKIDLGGFTIDGVSSVNSTFAFICAPGMGNISISDGRIANWEGVIETIGSVQLQGLRVEMCGSGSLSPYNLISGGSNSSLVDCTFIQSAMTDAALGPGATVLRYRSIHNGEGRSLIVGNRSVVTDCAVEQGAISAGEGSVVKRCAVRPSFGPGPTGPVTGISVGSGSTVIECTVSGGSIRSGILAGANCMVSHCTVSGQMLSPFVTSDLGIGAGPGSTIRDCKVTVSGNDTRGIGAPPGGEVRGCTVTAGASGIVAEGDGSTIDTNTITGTPTAILLSGTGNRVTRNSIRGAVAAVSPGVGNDVGPVGTAATATSPWANLVN